MSKRRAIIVAVTVEGISQGEAARRFGVSKGWVSKLIARWRAEGETAFEPRSRRPRTSPTRISDDVVEVIVSLRRTLTAEGLDAGPETIRWHLQAHHDITVSASTIRRRLIDAGLIEPAPKKRPRSSYLRFEAELPNEMWQTDVTYIELADGSHAEVLGWLDDHSRFCLGMVAHTRVGVATVVEDFHEVAGQHGYPASVLSDNGMYYTARFARGGATSRNRFETLLDTLGIAQKHSRPNHPQTCGKIERLHKTLKRWLTARPPAADPAGLQALLDEFRNHYNHHRPHTSLGRVPPTTAYTRLPKTGPAATPATEYRIRRDRIDKTGKVTLRHNSHLYKIGIGRPHQGTPIIMIITGLDIRIINTTTGELLRHLTLDTTRTYQPIQNTRNP